MMPTTTIWQNGQFIPWTDAKVHVLSHTLHYGGGAFEGIRFYQTDRGPAIFRLQEHIKRFLFSAKVLRMKLAYTQEEISMAIQKLININKIDEGYIRPIAYYGYGKLGVNPLKNPVESAIACWPWGAYLDHDSVDIKVSRYIRIHPKSTEVEAKLCGHYVNSILASLELQDTHYHEALLLDNDGYITEGVGENFFMVKANVIFTPKLGGILAGITRDTIIQLAKKLGFEVIEIDITLEQAFSADETFFTGTAAEVTSIRSINDKVIGNGKIGPITKIIKEKYMDIVHGRYPDFLDYLTFVERI